MSCSPWRNAETCSVLRYCGPPGHRNRRHRSGRSARRTTSPRRRAARSGRHRPRISPIVGTAHVRQPLARGPRPPADPPTVAAVAASDETVHVDPRRVHEHRAWLKQAFEHARREADRAEAGDDRPGGAAVGNGGGRGRDVEPDPPPWSPSGRRDAERAGATRREPAGAGQPSEPGHRRGP